MRVQLVCGSFLEKKNQQTSKFEAEEREYNFGGVIRHSY
jgi:hypothetical protein